MQFFILISSLLVLMYLAYKGYSTIVTAPILAVITLFFYHFTTHNTNISYMAAYTEIYMQGFANFIKNYFPLFLTGAIFAKLMDVSGYGKTIALSITKLLGQKRCILAVILSGAILTYGGVSLFVVAFVLYPIADILFQDANLPKRLIPGSIALGAFTFTMTALPGSPSVQNVIPVSYFGTDTFAAPVTGTIAAISMFSLGLIWLTWRAHIALKNGEGYQGTNHTILQENNHRLNSDSLTPPFYKSILPIAIIFIVNIYFSKFYFTHYNQIILDSYSIQLSNVAGTWSVILALISASIVLILMERKHLGSLKDILRDGASSSFLPLLNSSAIVGYGSVIQSIGIFQRIQSLIFGISSNPLISEALSINIICGLTASASGGLGMTLDAISPPLLTAASTLGISPELLHRIAALCSGGLDTLPHNGAVITTLAICGLTHKDAYFDIFMTSVFIPVFVSAVMVLLLTFL